MASEYVNLQQVNPASHHKRYTTAYRLTNRIPYQSSYCGEKLHVHQNEKLVLFGVMFVQLTDRGKQFHL